MVDEFYNRWLHLHHARQMLRAAKAHRARGDKRLAAVCLRHAGYHRRLIYKSGHHHVFANA